MKLKEDQKVSEVQEPSKKTLSDMFSGMSNIEIENNISLEHLPKAIKRHREAYNIWTTKEGRQIPITDMDESHIFNLLKMYIIKKRSNPKLHFSWESKLYSELERRNTQESKETLLKLSLLR